MSDGMLFLGLDRDMRISAAAVDDPRWAGDVARDVLDWLRSGRMVIWVRGPITLGAVYAPDEIGKRAP